MTDRELIVPSYVKLVFFFIGSIALLSILYIAQGIIVPLVFALIIAILLHPVVKFFVRFRINRIVAIIITIILVFLVIAVISNLLFSQVSRFSESWPQLVEKFTNIINDSISWVSGYFGINPQMIHEWITKTRGELISSSSGAIGKTIVTVGSTLVILFLIPVYTFLILYYEPLLIEFLHRFFGKSNHSQVGEIINQTKTVIQRYLIGLVIEAILVAALDSAALLILGIEYAVLIGIIGALLNVIPYIGGLVAVALPMMIALATKDSAWYAVYVLIAYYIIQLIDNNFIVPKIVASKVKINALFSIIVVIAGNALWGVPGMFLSLPLLAIVKLICDHIESLKPWGFLFGDAMPSTLKIEPKPKKIKKVIT